MPDAQTSFQVRLTTKVGLEAIAARVSRVLQCKFAPSTHKLFEGHPAFEAHVLGLWITLSYEPHPQQAIRSYWLVGTLQDRLEPKWEIDCQYIDIGPYILTLLHKQDTDEWYIPTKEELRSGVWKLSGNA